MQPFQTHLGHYFLLVIKQFYVLCGFSLKESGLLYAYFIKNMMIWMLRYKKLLEVKADKGK